MNISTISLENFRCFKELTVPLHPQLTVIVGKNGVGKTSILEAIAIALGTFLHPFDSISTVSVKKTDALNQYFSMGDGVDVQPQFPVRVSAQGELDGKNVSWSRALNGGNGKTTIVNAKEMTSYSTEQSDRMMTGDSTLILPLIAYYSTGRLWDYHRAKKSVEFIQSNRSQGYVDCLDGTANVKLMMSWFQKKTFAATQKGSISPEFSAVRRAMELCYTFISGHQEVEIQLDADTGELSILYTEVDGSCGKQPIHQLSDGYKGVISLIADIAYRMATLNPALGDRVLNETSGVVLIDEVDLHLHPAWQQRILGDLKTIFPKIQFITTTHAPAVIHSVKSENLLALNEFRVNEFLYEVYGKDVKSVFRDIMGVPERPNEVAQLFSDFYSLLDGKQFDKANKLLDEIEVIRDGHDPELASCRVKLKLERIRGGV